jgi:deoxyribonuclease V
MVALPLDAWTRRQQELRQRVRVEPLADLPRRVAGADCAFTPDYTHILAVALVWDRLSGDLLEVSRVQRPCEAPYVPGFLTFREGPAVAEALRALRTPFGAALFDAHGLAHPRGCGLATHIAVELDLVGVGAAKSLLVGTFAEPGPHKGDTSDLVYRKQVVGRVLRTRDRVRPVFVSVGHRVDLDSATALTLACCTRYRLPEPTRLADAHVARFKAETLGTPSRRLSAHDQPTLFSGDPL